MLMASVPRLFVTGWGSREANGGTEEELTVTERAWLKELERENQDLWAETAFLKKASAWLSRGSSGAEWAAA